MNGVNLIPLLMLIEVIFSSASFANQIPKKAIAQQINCQNPRSGVESKECVRLSYERADRRLNQVYQQLVTKLSKAQRQELTSAQQSWIQFRDNNCSFEVYGARGGTGYEGFRNNCLERITKERTTQLEKYLKGQYIL